MELASLRTLSSTEPSPEGMLNLKIPTIFRPSKYSSFIRIGSGLQRYFLSHCRRARGEKTVLMKL